tara:strand:- start:1339 stop:2478 length:1140 start_codon:yes stop_codon:yes gene_type:complete
MTVRVNKDSFNLREKLSELERPIGLKGSDLMSADTAQEARDFISAGRKNLMINGSMAVAQRGTSFTITSDSPAIYPADRYRFHLGGLGLSATVTATRETSSGVPGFPNSIKISNAGNNAGSSNTDSWIRYIMEVADYNFIDWVNTKKSLTLSFYARTNKPGQRSVSIVSGNFGQNHYVATFTLDTVDVWKKIEITVPPPPAFPTSGDLGMRLYWPMSIGSTYSTTTTNQWITAPPPPSSGTPFAATGDQKITGVDGATYEMTGVQLEVGKNATDFEHRSIGEELALCQRYYTQANTSGAGNPLLYFMQYSNSYRMLVADFPTTMRAAPSFQVTMGTGADGTGLTQSYNTSPHQGKAYVNVASTSANASWIWKYTADAEL